MDLVEWHFNGLGRLAGRRLIVESPQVFVGNGITGGIERLLVLLDVPSPVGISVFAPLTAKTHGEFALSEDKHCRRFGDPGLHYGDK
jgi:hypothetical protein